MAKGMDFDDLEKVFQNAQKEMPKVVEKTLNMQAEDLLGDAVDLAPLAEDGGGLRESGSVDPAKATGDNIEAKTGFNTEYALRMHEDFYNPTTPGTGRKYLEKPTNQNKEKYNEHMFQSVKDAWK
jgi:hypothetical protein